MTTRRERRQRAADMELGHRHPYLYGFGPVIGVAAVVVTLLLVALACWVIAPGGTARALKWAAWTVGAFAACWLFWLIALRPRRRLRWERFR